MEYQVIDMDDTAFVLINFPLVFFTTTANIFFGCCLIFRRQRFKHPLQTLLGFIFLCSIFYCMSLTASFFMKNTSTNFKVPVVSHMILENCTQSSMTCCAWLNFYYYVHIVPPQRPLLIWMKRNIKSVISVAVIAGMMLHSSNGAFNALMILRIQDNSNGTSGFIGTYDISPFFFCLMQLYIFICVCITMFSSFSTVHYLQTHMRRIAKIGNCLTSPKTQSQMRVAVTGTLQGLLFIFYYTFYLTDSILLASSTCFNLSDWVALTATMLYFSFSTVNMGIGQATIRQSAADVLKTLRALCIVGMVTNDVKLHSNQLT